MQAAEFDRCMRTRAARAAHVAERSLSSDACIAAQRFAGCQTGGCRQTNEPRIFHWPLVKRNAAKRKLKQEKGQRTRETRVCTGRRRCR
ncbi:hypothetical protein WS98_18730 [Burkholderia territorii]|nr:hypothetical protein WS98_18730 [Burkholderia territorii]